MTSLTEPRRRSLPPRLVAAVHAATAKRCTLLVAPTGHDKSALLGFAAAALGRGGLRDVVTLGPSAPEDEWVRGLSQLEASPAPALVLDDHHALSEDRAEALAAVLARRRPVLVSAGRQDPPAALLAALPPDSQRVTLTGTTLRWQREDLAACLPGSPDLVDETEPVPGTWPGLARHVAAADPATPDPELGYVSSVLAKADGPTKALLAQVAACGPVATDALPAVTGLAPDDALALLEATVPLHLGAAGTSQTVLLPAVVTRALRRLPVWQSEAEAARDRHIAWLEERGATGAAVRECLRTGRVQEAELRCYEYALRRLREPLGRIQPRQRIEFPESSTLVPALRAWLRHRAHQASSADATLDLVRRLTVSTDPMTRSRVAALLLSVSEHDSYQLLREHLELASSVLAEPGAQHPVGAHDAFAALCRARYLLAHGELLQTRCVVDQGRTGDASVPAWIDASLAACGALASALIGNTYEAEELAHAAVEAGLDLDPTIAAEAHVALAAVHQERGETALATEALKRAAPLRVRPFVRTVATVLAVRDKLQRNLVAEAAALLPRPGDEHVTTSPYEGYLLAAATADVALTMGAVLEVVQQLHLMSCCGVPPEHDIKIATLRARLELQRNAPRSAYDILAPYVLVADRRESRQLLQALVTLAVAAERCGRLEETIGALQRAGAMAASLGIATDAGMHTVITRTMRPRALDLTAAERTVLRALTQPIPISRVAEELFISPNTLKTHTRRLYSKLGVKDRAGAVELAAILRLA